MKKFMSKLFGAENNTASSRPAPSGFRPQVEGLESRALMSVSPVSLHVNTTTALNQDQVAVASQPTVNGGSVVAWRTQFNTSGTDTDIKVQRYDGFGNKIGSQITVASNSFRESEPSVAMAANGSFVVVWTSDVNNSGNTNILAQRFFANGLRNGGVITVASDARREFDADVAMDAAGNFAVSYTFQFSATDRDVHVRRFSAGGALLGTSAVAASGRNEHSSSIARSADGRFSVAYQVDLPKTGGGINSDIRLNRYSSAGTLLTTHNIANTSVNETDPEIAMSNAGTTVVVYEHAFSNLDHDIKARKVFSNGALGSTMNVETNSEYQFNPTVTMDLSDGDFVVAYQQLDNTGTSLAGPNNMIVREMTAGGSLKSTTNLGDRATGSLAINASDRYFLGETAFNLSGDPGLGIFAHRGIIV